MKPSGEIPQIGISHLKMAKWWNSLDGYLSLMKPSGKIHLFVSHPLNYFTLWPASIFSKLQIIVWVSQLHKDSC